MNFNILVLFYLHSESLQQTPVLQYSDQQIVLQINPIVQNPDAQITATQIIMSTTHSKGQQQVTHKTQKATAQQAVNLSLINQI